jgi:hypothetical protein
MGASEIRTIISERGVAPGRLYDALRRLAPEGSAGWLGAIANDDTYPTYQRIACAARLLECCARPGTDLAEVSRLLMPASWLTDDAVEEVTTVFGELPVTWNPADTVFVLRPAGEPHVGALPAIYFRLSGRVGRYVFLRVMRGTATPPIPIIVEEIAVVWPEPGP